MDFSRCSRATSSVVHDPIRMNLELSPDFVIVLITCKNEEDPIKNEGTRVATRLYVHFFRRLGADNSGVSGGIWLKFEIIQAFVHILVTCKNEDDSIKMKGLEWSQHFTHYKSMGIFPDAQVQLTLQSLVQSVRILNSS